MSILQPLPARPEPIAPDTETCHCCAGVERDTPLMVWNRPGLGVVAYRIGTYTQFRASLHAGLSSSAFTPLLRLRTRDGDDFTIALLDAVACAADVLTFYQERIANESFLRTASQRVSLQELGRAIGYQLRPGLAAETYLAFTLEAPPVPPANLKPEPGLFISGVPSELTLAAGLAVRSVPAPQQQPQVFETVETIVARPEWNAIRPWLSEARAPQKGDRVAYLKGVRNSLKAGDAFLLLGPEYLSDQDDNSWDFRILDRVELQAEHDRTRVSWQRPLGSLQPPADPSQQAQAWALRRHGSVYGHNAPAWGSMSKKFRTDYEKTFKRAEGSPSSGWPNFVISPAGASSGGGSIDLDAVYGEVAANSFVALAKGGFNYLNEPAPAGTYVELYSATTVSEVSREEFALSGKVTRLRLRGDNYSLFANAVRETSAFVQSEALDLAEYPVTAAIAGAQVPAAIDAAGLEPGRRLIVRGIRQSDGTTIVHNATLVAAHSLGDGRCTLEITPPLPAALTRDTVIVYGNVALASHGESVAQVLGSGDASVPFQRFELKQLPLTHRAATTELGAASELTVRVDELEWQERTTLYGAAPEDRSYTLQTDEQGRQFVQFGDGQQGARLSSNTNNVRAWYRKGLGAAGNVAADSMTQLSARPLGLKGVSNPLPAEGGTDAEHLEQARQTIPLITRTLGRAVSLLDYEDFARAFSGVAKARAQVLRLNTGPTVVITIAGADNTVISPDSAVWKNLGSALIESGDPHVAVRLLAHSKSTFRLGLKVKIDPAYDSATVLDQVEATLRAHFDFDSRALGQPVQQSEVIAIAHSVAGVVAVDLDLLYGGTHPAQMLPSRQTRLLAEGMHVQAGIPIAAELLTLDPAPFDRLEQMQ